MAEEGVPLLDREHAHVLAGLLEADNPPVGPLRDRMIRWLRDLEGRVAAPPQIPRWTVHNHGPDEGPGRNCRESLIGNCLRFAAAAPSGGVGRAREALRLLSRARTYVNHQSYDRALAAEIDAFLAAPPAPADLGEVQP